MALASLILIVLAASVLVVTCAVSHTETPSSATSPKQKCIKVKKCPKNEEFSICTQSIGRAQFCSQKGQTLWQQKDTPTCTEGCVCKNKFLRNYNGTCIPECKCSTDCGPDEVLDDCPVDCPSDYCPISDERSLSCPRPDSDKCPPAVCKCGFNRRKAVNGTCILTRDCPPVDCSALPFQEYVACPPLCPTDDCSQASENGQCPNQFGNILIILPCNPTCRCIKGYWRKNGICVPYEECNIPSSCPANEEVRCVDECPPEKTCKNRGIEYDCVAPVHPCQHKCVCKNGYYRNDAGNCISDKECDIPTSCPVNEEVRCVNKCPPERTCENRGRQYKCATPVDPCENKCVCKKGYYRNSLGTCITEDKCANTSCPVNEEYVPCIQGVCRAMNCSQKGESIPCPDRKWPEEECDAGCICKENHLRNDDGLCVPEDQCETEPEPTCGDNEVLDTCPSDCASDYCPTSEKDNKKCPQPKPCPPPKCKCRLNFRRSKNGSCIPTRNCPPFDCKAKPNEQWTACPPLCPSDTCSLSRVKGVCPFKIGIVLECNPKCQCKEGYGRVESNGKCVPYEDCPNLCPVNEEYNSCTQAVCRNQNCTNKDGPVFCPRIDPAYCIKGCVCKENHYRNSNGTCVAYDECDDIPTSCPANEEVRCVYECPPERTCKTRDLQYRCMAPVEPCQNKCVCKEGYYRNYLGTCITDKECDKCLGDNEFFACGGACDNECSQHEQNRTNCRIQNIVCNRKCYCEDGFARDIHRNCVPVEECPNTSCPVNEEYVPCIQGVCRAMNCSQKGESIPCPDRKWPEEECDAGCICKENHLRNEDGLCVPEDQCETDLCPSNEEYNSCTQALCRPQNCTNRYKLQPCPKVKPSSCKRDCVCKPDYFRNENGTCVTEDECVDKQCPNPNEKFAMSQQPSYPALGTCMSITARIGCDKPESLGCICKSGFLRDDKTSICIPICKCPQMASSPECKNKRLIG